MNQGEFDKLSDHEYDGIREYDNPTPGWWVLIFVFTIVFSLFYFLYYHAPVKDRSVYDGYEAAKAADLKKQFVKFGELKLDESSVLSYMQSDDHLKIGRAIFKEKCVSCHGDSGEGMVGPNLTDEYYKNIKRLGDIPMVISNGANNGAMPAWKLGANPSGLNNNEIAVVSAYVASLRGKNLPGPRGAEGEIIPPWPKPAPTQSATAATRP